MHLPYTVNGKKNLPEKMGYLKTVKKANTMLISKCGITIK